MTSDELTVLGHQVGVEEAPLETIAVDRRLMEVSFSGDELVAVCPATGQPDFYHWEVRFVPKERSIETKSLKLFLWRYRDRGVFAEDLAVDIAEALAAELGTHVEVTLTQQVRGGIVTTVMARDFPS